jgi:hypothetical protein
VRLALPLQIAIVLGVFALVSLIASLAGAVNLGTALGIGQIGFALAVTVLILRN